MAATCDVPFPLTDTSRRPNPSHFRSNSWKNLLTEDPRLFPEESLCYFELPDNDYAKVKEEKKATIERVASDIFMDINSDQDDDRMEKFPPDRVTDFKHVIYNLCVDAHNSKNPKNSLVFPCTVELGGKTRDGFQFNEEMDPDKRIPELYGYHIHNSRLELENQESPFIQDLYKFYLRAGVELLGKYFEKLGKHVFLYDQESPLFVPGGSLQDAEVRIKKMRTRARKREREREPAEEPHTKKKRNSSRKIPYLVKCGLKP